MTPAVRHALTERLKLDEALRLKPYRDSVGKLTIGYGRNLDDVGITPEESRILLENDIRRAEADLIRTFDWYKDLDGPRQAVLVNMGFNLGLTRLLSFHKALRAMHNRRWDEAADEMLSSRWATQVGARAKRLALQMRTGVVQP
jgi:lysozyme